MITFERTQDYALVESIVRHPKIYRHISDDGSPAAEDYRTPESDAIWYVLAKDGDAVLGVLTFVPQNAVCYDVHTCLLPESWGRARGIMRGVITWMWEQSPAQRIVGNVPEFNRLALHFAKDADFKVFGINEASFLKNGHLHDQIMLGVSKPCH